MKFLISSLAVVLFGISGCGGGAKHATPMKARTGKPSRVYHVKLSGRTEVPPGALNASGAAVIAVHGSSVVCWRFAHLHGFTGATFAHIHVGAHGKSGNIVVPLSTGPRLHHQGCLPVSAALINAIEKNPRGYYVNIHSTRYPGGAVRAQL